jgi:TfoX/Sxy family transcriptional regulator of competence genes
MAYDKDFAERIRAITAQHSHVTEKAMFGGIAFMAYERMAFGIVEQKLMVRVGPERCESALAQRHVEPMLFTGRPMRGMVYVMPEGTRTQSALQKWIELALEVAAASPPKAPKFKRVSKPTPEISAGAKKTKKHAPKTQRGRGV